MMVQGKAFLLLAVFLLIVVDSNYADSDAREGDTASGTTDEHKDKDKDKDKDDHEWKETSRRHRYSSYGPSMSNYRTRSRWPLSQEDMGDSFGWLQPEFPGNSFQSIFPAPTPAMTYDVGASRTNPACYSLIDAQYPLFSDICGAVPQARYMLPNVFGHRERWQIAQTLASMLTQMAAASADQSCTRSLRLLICPILFPPCPTRFETPVLPCQSLCRSVKQQCPSATLDLLPCEFLPTVSDICPAPTGYGSFGMPTGYPSFAASSSMPSGFPSFAASSGMPTGFPSFAASSSMPTGFPSFGGSSMGYPGARPQSLFPSATPAGATPPLSLFNNGALSGDSLTPVLVDFPPRGFGNGRFATPGRPMADGY